MADKLTLSIAMTTYNGERFLQEQLDSFLQQTRLPDELVICDDCSKDATVQLLHNFASKASFPVRILINPLNLGFAKNFEKAISLCQGDIIVLSDQDDVWLSEKLDRLEDAFRASPSLGAVFTDAYLVDAQLRPMKWQLWDAVRFTSTQRRRFKSGQAFAILLKQYVVTGATMGFRANLKKLVLPIPPSWYHDAWIALLIAAASEITCIPDPLIKYRQHAGNQLGVRKHAMIEELRLASKSHSLYLEAQERFQQVYARLISQCNSQILAKTIPLLKEKMLHLHNRAILRQQRLQGYQSAMRELLSCRYHRYSRGFYSFFNDVLL